MTNVSCNGEAIALPQTSHCMPGNPRIAAAGYPMHAMLWGIDRAAIFFAEANRPVPGRLSWLRNASLGPKRTEQPGHGGLQPNGSEL